jgi:hypothetical protein
VRSCRNFWRELENFSSTFECLSKHVCHYLEFSDSIQSLPSSYTPFLLTGRGVKDLKYHSPDSNRKYSYLKKIRNFLNNCTTVFLIVSFLLSNIKGSNKSFTVKGMPKLFLLYAFYCGIYINFIAPMKDKKERYMSEWKTIHQLEVAGGRYTIEYYLMFRSLKFSFNLKWIISKSVYLTFRILPVSSPKLYDGFRCSLDIKFLY